MKRDYDEDIALLGLQSSAAGKGPVQCDQMWRFFALWSTFIDIWRFFSGHTGPVVHSKEAILVKPTFL